IRGLEPHALLVRRIFSGTDRRGGGAFERPFLMLLLIDTAGRVARSEHFDVDRDARAPARFDELVAEPRTALRRLRPNAATAAAARHDAAVAKRDASAVAMLRTEDYETVDHTTGTSHGRPELLANYRRQFRNEDLTRRRETLATLGDSLVLSRTRWSASGAASTTFDVGTWELDKLSLIEVDGQGRIRRTELF